MSMIFFGPEVESDSEEVRILHLRLCVVYVCKLLTICHKGMTHIACASCLLHVFKVCTA